MQRSQQLEIPRVQRRSFLKRTLRIFEKVHRKAHSVEAGQAAARTARAIRGDAVRMKPALERGASS